MQIWSTLPFKRTHLLVQTFLPSLFILQYSPSHFFLPPSPYNLSDAAVQEERQRNREREGELEFSVGVNEEMPVEKILEAETAVEQKTELHTDGGSAGNSVSC